ncbi:MAG: hypothetical protein KC777_28620, partial [Cyanobacteria bacterium HKST-UBA02]|nr:hypothetical protein [Cyanobacteria bacterium HKST-UBA02]
MDELIEEIIASWGINPVYSIDEMNKSRIVQWIGQFREHERLPMLKLLRSLEFFTYRRLRTIEIPEMYDKIIARTDLPSIAQIKHSPDRIVFVAFGSSPAKSSSVLLHTMTLSKGARIPSGMILWYETLQAHLVANPKIEHIILVDDILGSGETLVSSLDQIGQLMKDRHVSLSCVGTTDAVNSSMITHRYNFASFTVLANHAFNRCFSIDAGIFDSIDESVQAMEIARTYGSSLCNLHPLGFDNGQLLVTFYENCPDNSLPILWYDEHEDWRPLFPRSGE